ncbi:MAG: ABC transporter substrate-binding protein [Alphaproteobacteria bacterium]|jgi:iron complex transport system substrate-binding protein|nr:ABC transporter substrate-binding protein [Alphaproteobacteria bacterium]
MTALLRILAIALALVAATRAQAADRVVAVGGALTEIVYALGAADLLVGVDTTSQYPAAARTLPQVGYMRQLSAEGVLSLSPTLLLITEEAGPPAVLRQLQAAGLRTVLLPGGYQPGAVRARIEGVAKAVGQEDRGQALAARVDQDVARIAEALKGAREPRVLFLMTGTAGGTPLASGGRTAADALITLSGGINAVSAYDGYKPLTPEAALAADPDFILVPAHAIDALGGVKALAAMPGLKDTRAVRANRVVAMDMLTMLGFGPRIAVAMRQLAAALHPGLDLPAVSEPSLP